jgi:sterol desaturase/sphingolipid hydroxylase (fatty acid hydroxylase superfamily)
MDDLILRLGPASVWLAILWCIESFVGPPTSQRIQHGLINLALAGLNGLVLFSTLGALSIWVASVSPFKPPASFGAAHAIACFVALDLLSYCWHRLNHTVPLLWRFHSVHHSDTEMDVTTAGRFHTFEIAIGAVLRLPLLYFLGVSSMTLVAYETTLLLVSMFHHSSLSLGSYDRYYRLLSASPRMHSIHHSRERIDHDSNFSSVFSLWDRVFGTFRLTDGPVSHGLDHVDSKSLTTLIVQPFVTSHSREQAQDCRDKPQDDLYSD